MWRARLALLTALIPIASQLFAACQCTIRFGVCDETRESDAVFIGTVESVAPPFLDPYHRARAGWPSAAEIAGLQANPSPEALEKLKTVYAEMLKGIPAPSLDQIAAATTQQELEVAFEAAAREGRFAHFRVRTVYKRQSGDDDDDDAAAATAKRDKDDDPGFLDIWSSSGDCGVDFQPGETYLVYAVEDEDSGKLETSACMRTRRLSDEGGDLSYLYFLQNDKDQSAQIAGFVSRSFNDQAVPRYEDAINSPLSGLLLELTQGDQQARYTQSDRDGRFAFSGLGKGDYRLSLLAAGYPASPRRELLSRTLHVDEGSCVRQILVAPQRPNSTEP